MLFLNIRQIELVHRILKYEYLQSDEIINYFMISSRTLQSDINLINFEFEKNDYGLAISVHRKKGYYIESLLKKYRSVEQLKNQCIDFLNNSILRELGSQPRVCFILRKLLIEKNFIKSEDLIDELHISNATLTNDLKLTRNVLDGYGIDINSVPYYGMQIIGDPLRIRSCLLDFCDIYNFHDRTSIFPENAYEQYHFSRQEMINARKKLSHILNESSILLTDKGFQFVLLNVLLVKSQSANRLQFDFCERTKFQAIHAVSSQIANSFEIVDPAEIDYLSLQILIHLDDITVDSPSNDIQFSNEIRNDVETLRLKIASRYNLDFGLYPSILKTLELFTLKTYLRRKFRIMEKSVSSTSRDLVCQIPASRSIALLILRLLYPEKEIDIYPFLELSIIIFNSIFSIPNNYADIRIAYVNKISRFSSKSVAYRNTLSRYNIDIDYLSSYDLDSIDLIKYDGIITSGTTQLEREECPIVMLEFDYFDMNRNSSELWEKLILKRRVDELILPKLTRVEKRVIMAYERDLVHEISKYLTLAGFVNDDLVQQITDGISTSQKLNGNISQMFCIFSQKELENTVYQFTLENEVLYNGSFIGEISIIVLSPDNNILTIKQADSAIRRLYQQTILNRS